MAKTADKVELKEETRVAFEDYISHAEGEMDEEVSAGVPFLWSDRFDERSKSVEHGQTVAEFWSGKRPVKVPVGLIHDWVGATRLDGTTLTETLALIQDYDNHKNVYQPEVLDSRLIHRSGDHFQIFLRLMKKKIITVILDTDHDVQYSSWGSERATCRSRTTRISEVDDAGKPTERVGAPDTGYGFLWRLYSYWRFEERGGGVIAECRAVSLTRDVPKGLGWIIEPIVEKLPKESLRGTLEATRRALTRCAETPEAGAA